MKVVRGSSIVTISIVTAVAGLLQQFGRLSLAGEVRVGLDVPMEQFRERDGGIEVAPKFVRAIKSFGEAFNFAEMFVEE